MRTMQNGDFKNLFHSKCIIWNYYVKWKFPSLTAALVTLSSYQKHIILSVSL